MISKFFTTWKRELTTIIVLYVVLSVFFLFGLIVSSGDVAQGDWGIPLTVDAATNDFNSRLFVRSFNGFGELTIGRWGFPYFPFANAVLAWLGFVGGIEIKVLSVFLVSLSGIASYIFARSFGLGRLSSFLSGLFFMSTAVVFDWLMLGWYYYLIGYGLFPLMLLTTKKFVETNKIHYALISGLILSIVASQPAFLLIYPTLGFVFVLFSSKGFFSAVRKAFIVTAISLSVWFLTALSFFTSYNNSETLSFYHGDYFAVIQYQFGNLINIVNPLRLWGSTYNFQFETYFPQELIFLSFVPVVLAAVLLLFKPRDKRIFFFFLSYMFVFVAFHISQNLSFIVFNLPFGAVFEALSVFLVPACLGLAVLMGFANEVIAVFCARFSRFFSLRQFRRIFFVFLLVLIICVGAPWWMGQTSGEPLHGSPTKLNLYSVPSSFTVWSDVVKADHNYFIFYVPFSTNPQIVNSTFFSQAYEGVNMGIFTELNTLPYISDIRSPFLLNALMNGTSIAEQWGNYSIRFIVVYTNVESDYNMSDILNNLSFQEGLVKVATLPDVVVFENEYVKPVVYTDNADAEVQILYHDPTLFKVQANSTDPFTVVFNQVYSSGWRAWVNGSVLPDSAHFKDADGFNSWQIDSKGTMIIDIYYEPQTTYAIAMAISTVTIIVILTYLTFTVVKKYRSAHVISKREVGLAFPV